MPPGTATTKPLNLPTYDPDMAKQLIAESGVTDLAFEFWYPSDVARPYMPDPKGEFESILRDLEAGFHPVRQYQIPSRPDGRQPRLQRQHGGIKPERLGGHQGDA